MEGYLHVLNCILPRSSKYFLSNEKKLVILQLQTGRNPFAERKRIFALSSGVNFDTSLKVMQRVL